MAITTLHIGVGGRGRVHVGNLTRRDDTTLVGLCDIKDEALAKAREVTGLGEAVCYTDWRVALAQVQSDAVVISTPPQLHYEMCLAAVRAGRHVLVEKPFTMDLAEACEVVAAADAAGVKLAVAQQVRHIPVYRQAAALLRDELGWPEFGMLVQASFRSRVRHSADQRHSYAWERGIHDFDTMMALFDARPVSVRARSYNPSWSVYRHGSGMDAVVELDSGAVCSVVCSFMSRRGDVGWGLDAPGGSVEIADPVLRVRRVDAEEPEEVTMTAEPAAEMRVVDLWVEWLGGGTEPPHGMHHNLWTVALVEATGVASDESRVVDVADYLAARRG